MITVRSVHKAFGVQTLFEGANLQINSGDRFALVGPNGSGKSTLFKMLLNEVRPDSGEIQFRRGVAVSYLPQENAPVSCLTVVEEVLAMTSDPTGRSEAKAKSILMGLGFKVQDFGRKADTLSGGWAMRAAMARLLLEEPDLLMLDEPTNHLDLESMLWFQNYLLNYRGSIFLISHDRGFINAICRSVVSVQDRTLKVYHGNYEYYLKERDAERERLEQAYREQQSQIEDMKDFIARNRVRASTAGRAQSMIKRLEKLERIELPADARTVKIRFPQPERVGVRTLALKGVHKSYGETKVYEGLDFELERGWKVGFVGHNGAGKSTLMKILADVIPVDKGERIPGMNVKVGYFAQHRAKTLDPGKTVLEEAMNAGHEMSEQAVRTVLGSFLFPGDTVFKKVEVLSGGEKSRLSLVKILLDPPNVLLMDEPTTHLDLESVGALISALSEFEGTLCFISHDLYFVNSLANHIVHVDKGKVTLYPGNYEYYERRMEQNERAPPRSDERPEPREKTPDKTGRPSAREGRRQRAWARERESRRKKEDAGRTDRGAAARERIDELTRELEQPHVYGDYVKVRKISKEIEALQAEISPDIQAG